MPGSEFHKPEASAPNEPDLSAVDVPESVAAGIKISLVNASFSTECETTISEGWRDFLRGLGADAKAAADRYPADVAQFSFNLARAELAAGESQNADNAFIETLRLAGRLESSNRLRHSLIVASEVNRSTIMLQQGQAPNAQIDTLDRRLVDGTLNAYERAAVALNLFLLREQRKQEGGSTTLLEVTVNEARRVPGVGNHTEWLLFAAQTIGERAIEAQDFERSTKFFMQALAAADSLKVSGAERTVPLRYMLMLSLMHQGKLDDCRGLSAGLIMQLSKRRQDAIGIATLLQVCMCVQVAASVLAGNPDGASAMLGRIVRLEQSMEPELDGMAGQTMGTIIKQLRKHGFRPQAVVLKRFLG